MHLRRVVHVCKHTVHTLVLCGLQMAASYCSQGVLQGRSLHGSVVGVHASGMLPCTVVAAQLVGGGACSVHCGKGSRWVCCTLVAASRLAA
jgi:hypothetical protein